MMKIYALRSIVYVLTLFAGLALPISQSMAIQTDAFPDDQRIILQKDDVAIFEDARKALSSAIGTYQTTTKSVQKTPSPAESKALKNSLAKIRVHAEIIRVLAKAAGNKTGISIADQMIINDDILGRKLTIEAAAKKLGDLQQRLRLIEPSVQK